MKAISTLIKTNTTAYTVVKYAIAIIVLMFITLSPQKKLLSNLDESLPDRFDHSHLAWQTNISAKRIINGNFSELYNLPHFYPRLNTLVYSDSLITQSVQVAIASFFVNSPISRYNLVFLFNLTLSSIALFLLLKITLDNFWTSLLVSSIYSYSPFVLSHLGHHQLITVWPTYFSLIISYLLIFKSFNKLFWGLSLGLFVGIQFYASQILAVFLVITIFLMAITRLISVKNKIKFIKTKFLSAILAIVTTSFLLLPFFNQLYLHKQEFTSMWDERQFIIYSAYPSDYLFPHKYSALNQVFFSKWNLHNLHVSSERAFSWGLFTTIVVIVYILIFSVINNNELSINLPKKKTLLLFSLLLMATGFIFSLGPRLQLLDNYIGIPLPYYLIYKLPVFQEIRAPSRWYFLFILGSAFMNTLLISKINNRFKSKTSLVFIVLITVVGFLEFYPVSVLPIYRLDNNNKVSAYKELSSIEQDCKSPLLVYPTQKQNANSHIDNHAYKKNILLNQLIHECPLFNGDASFDPPSYIKDAEIIDSNLLSDESLSIIKKVQIRYLIINKYALNTSNHLQDDLNDNFKLIYKDEDQELYKIVNMSSF